MNHLQRPDFRPDAIAGGKDVGVRGLHSGVDQDPAAIGFDPGPFQSEPAGGRAPAQRDQDLLGGKGSFPRRGVDGDLFAAVGRLFKPCDVGLGDDRHALAFQVTGQGDPDRRVHSREHVGRTLDDGYRNAQTQEELGKFQRHRAPADDQQRFGQAVQGLGLVGVDVADIGESRQRRYRNLRAGGHGEFGRGQYLSVDLNRVRTQEFGAAGDYFDVGQLFGRNPAVAGEFLDQLILALPDRRPIDARAGTADPEIVGFTHQLGDFGRAQQSFGRHAAAQDAQPPEAFGGLDQPHPESGRRGGAGGVITGRPAADHYEIKRQLGGLRSGFAGRRNSSRARRNCPRGGAGP